MVFKVLITGKLVSSAVKKLSDHPLFEVVDLPECSTEELFAKISTANILITRSETAISSELIHQAKELKIIARACVGVANVDIKAATERGILVINTPGKNTNSAAELTFGLLLSLSRNIFKAQQTLVAGGWDRHRFTGTELRGKTIGIVGLGNVGHRIAKFCLGFDMRVLGFDPYISPSRFQRLGVKPVDTIINLAKQSDILTVHVPLTNETTNLISSEVMSHLHAKAFILNTSRGGIINEDDLYNALRNKKIAGAGIDTWNFEPHPREDLVKHPNVICTPHIGASTTEAQEIIGTTIVEQLCKAVQGDVVDYSVNLPHMGVSPELIRPYTVLAEKLGSLASQLSSFNPSTIEIHYRGDLAEKTHELLQIGLMKGYISSIVDSYVSYVNAEHHFAKLGIQIEETFDQDFKDYQSALRIILRNSESKLEVGGTVFEGRFIRITKIDYFSMELKPKGRFLIVRNRDRMGVIGALGNVLAEANINIETFSLSRNQPGGEAMAIVQTDGTISPAFLKSISKMPNIIEANLVDL